MTNSDDSRQSMLSVPTRWRDLYFDIFGGLCAVGTTSVIYYGLFRSPPDADALDIAMDMLPLMAAVPIVAALLAYLIMRGRDLAMKTWETFKRERFDSGVELGMKKGREEGREEGIEIGTRRAIREIRERLARREASERGERDDWLDEILSELSENGGGEKRRPRS